MRKINFLFVGKAMIRYFILLIGLTVFYGLFNSFWMVSIFTARGILFAFIESLTVVTVFAFPTSLSIFKIKG